MSAPLPFLFVLYVCQGLPGGFLAVVLPVVLREQGLDLKTVGLASALSLPWVLKVLWAPLVDRYGSERFGRHRSWLVPSQLGMLSVTVALTFVQPQDDLAAVVALFFALNVCSATQDIAVDGWAVRLLEGRVLGPANGAQVSGFKVGNLIGGGVLVGLLGTVGWSGDFWLMSALLAAALVMVLRTSEPLSPRPPPRRVVPELLRSVRRQGWVFWAFVVFSKFGESLGGVLVKPLLVDRGYSRELIGVLDGFAGGVAVVAGASLAGWLVRVRGWPWVLLCASTVQGLALVALGAASAGSTLPVAVFVPLNVVESAAGGGVAVCMFTLAMGRADKSIGASDFTVSQVFYMLGAFVAGPAGGALGDACGYMPTLCVSGALAVGLGVVAPAAGRRFGRPAASPSAALNPPRGQRSRSR